MANHGSQVTGEWRSLVAHLLWEQRVAGSNPVSPTIFDFDNPGDCRKIENQIIVLGSPPDCLRALMGL